MSQVQLGEIVIDVILKDIKNVHLSVNPPHGHVRISAPMHMELDMIRLYAISRLAWIKKHQKKFKAQKREAPREYVSRESHYYLGKRHLLKVIESNKPNKVVLKHSTIELHIRPETNREKRKEILNEWYRAQLKDLVANQIDKWEKTMELKVNEFGIKKMKTKWGTCNRDAKRIWINLELAKKPVQCIEYIVVHEMIHFLERNHTDRFVSLMNNYLPNWRELKEELNRLPVSHIEWEY